MQRRNAGRKVDLNLPVDEMQILAAQIEHPAARRALRLLTWLLDDEDAMAPDDVVRALDAFWREAARPGSTIDVMAGFYERHEGTLYNSALYARLGGAEPVLLHVHRKNFLPTYGMFDEERFVVQA